MIPANGSSLHVTCEPDGRGWRCRVTVGDDPAATGHDVTLEADDLERLGGAADRPEALVAASFAFLLEREPRESILRAFALPVIGSYFPEYETEIRRRLAGEGSA
jgi:hypothetical protein